MTERLPTELILTVVREAAELFVISHRASALSLALTAGFVGDIVRPILYRRVFVSEDNIDKIDRVFKTTDYGKFVLDMCISASEWRPDSDIIHHFKHLQCLRGTEEPIVHLTKGLSSAGYRSLFKTHLWESGLDPSLVGNLPPALTHLGLYFSSLIALYVPGIRNCLDKVPSLKHLAFEFVVRKEDAVWPDYAEPEVFTRGLCDSLEAVGERLESLSFHLCGNISDDLWVEYVKKAQQAGRDESIKHRDMGSRIRIWRDQRVLENTKADMMACKIDTYMGVDVWSEAQPLSELN